MAGSSETIASFIESYVASSVKAQHSLLGLKSEIATAVNLLADCIRQGGKIYSCGNGGSACEAIHIAEELVARYLRERPAIPAQHFCDASTITCWGNDYEFNSIFKRQVEAFVGEQDVLIVLTTSGNSENILQAMQAAKAKKAKILAFLGKDGGKAKALADLSLIIPLQITSHVQEAHLSLVHIICDRLELGLYPEAK